MSKFVVTGDTYRMSHGIEEGAIVILAEDDGSHTKGYTPADEDHYLYGSVQYIHDKDVKPFEEK